MIKGKNIDRNGLLFAAAMWLSSRMFIGIAMLLIAPLLPVPPQGVAATVSWDVFHGWDSNFYEKIATIGYDVSLTAFFPLFPILIRAFMTLGLSFFK